MAQILVFKQVQTCAPVNWFLSTLYVRQLEALDVLRFVTSSPGLYSFVGFFCVDYPSSNFAAQSIPSLTLKNNAGANTRFLISLMT